MCKSYNKEIGKPDESLGRKATGPVKWQPVAEIVGTVCLTVFFIFIFSQEISVDTMRKAYDHDTAIQMITMQFQVS